MTWTAEQRAALEAQLAGYAADRDRLLAQVNALGGAIQALQTLLAPDPPPAPDPDPPPAEE